MLHVLLLALVTAAFFALCAALPRHQAHLLSRKLKPALSQRVRMAGWLILALAFLIAWQAYGFGRGLILFAGIATLGAASVVGLLSARSHK